MANDVLNSLLRQYEQKKVKAELDLEKRKETLYNLIPRLKQIDDELNNFAILTARNILNNSNKNAFFISDLNDKISKLKIEKEQILKQNNYSIDYLKPFYECKICCDTGYITDSTYHTVMCSCLKQKLLDISFNESNIYNLKKENFDNFNENLFSNKINASKYKTNISPRENILNIKNKCMEFIANFDNPEQKNLLFTGSTGLR